MESAGFAAVEGAGSSEKDFSIRLDTFDLVDRLPAGTIRVAESGLDAGNVATVTGKFHAALVGTSLLRDPAGIRAGLFAFEQALA